MKQAKLNIGVLAMYGADAVKISYKQKMKLKKWIIPYSLEDFNIESNSEPLKLIEFRKFVDSWEHEDLNERVCEHYYVDKNSKGDSWWDGWGLR